MPLGGSRRTAGSALETSGRVCSARSHGKVIGDGWVAFTATGLGEGDRGSGVRRRAPEAARVHRSVFLGYEPDPLSRGSDAPFPRSSSPRAAARVNARLAAGRPGAQGSRGAVALWPRLEVWSIQPAGPRARRSRHRVATDLIEAAGLEGAQPRRRPCRVVGPRSRG